MKKKYHLLWICCSLLIACCSRNTGTGLIEDPVRIETGPVAGVAGPDSTVKIYKGIPFATPPTGDLRWRPPQPPASWDSVRNADRFSASCIQEKVGSRPPWTEEFMVQNEISEDCLYLNIWTPARRAGAALPVLVYIHGGGFNEGSGAIDLYNGSNLAEKGLVVVTINYRLGVLGFLAHPELTEESPHNASGTYGLLDQLAALRWVRDNIAAFGGDPGRVTVSGQSAGAVSVYALTASPLAESLFHRAIIQSGPGALASFGLATTAETTRPLERAESTGLKFAKAKQASSIRELREMPVEKLTAPVEGAELARFWPVVDGWFLPVSIEAAYRTGKQHDLPVISGMNADEASAFPGYGSANPEEFKNQVMERYGSSATGILEQYPSDTKEEAGQSEIALQRDLGAAALRRLAAERAETSSSDQFLYYFGRAIPWPAHPEFGAFHTAEVPYVFHNLDKLDRPWKEQDRRIADTISSYWVQFAATGDPNGSDLPRWPAYSERDVRFMVFRDSIQVRSLPEEPKAELLFDYLDQQAGPESQ